MFRARDRCLDLSRQKRDVHWTENEESCKADQMRPGRAVKFREDVSHAHTNTGAQQIKGKKDTWDTQL